MSDAAMHGSAGGSRPRSQRRPPRPTLLVITQVYPPDPAAAGQYLADVSEEMVRRGWRVVVYTAGRGYDDPRQRYPARERRGGVDVRRLPLSSFGKSSLAVRLIAQGLFTAQALVRGLFTRGLSRVLVSTSPPFAGAAGGIIASIRRVPLLWWVMDLNPDQLVAAGRISPSHWAVRLFDVLNRFTLRHAAETVVLDECMQARVVAKARTPPPVVHVIPPWPLEQVTTAAADGAERFRRRHGLEAAFVVLYAGNHSPQNPLDTLLKSVGRLAHRQDIRFVFIGGGTDKAAIDRLVAAGAGNVVSLPYQPAHVVGEALAAADVHVVSVGDAMVGILHPSKIYTAMAAGRPVLLYGPTTCPAGDVLAATGIGWHVRHGDGAASDRAILEAVALPAETRVALGRRGQDAIAERFAGSILRRRLCDLLDASFAPDTP